MAFDAAPIAACAKSLIALYELSVQRAGKNIDFVERHLERSSEPERHSEDDQRNESTIHTTLFSNECRSYLESLYSEAIRGLGAVTFANGEDLLNGLQFIQNVIATALWKYHCDVGPVLESFAREFDRLDVESERRRLYDRARREQVRL